MGDRRLANIISALEKKFLYVPFCFMGMGIFRVWTETLYANSELRIPAQVLPVALPSVDAYALFDITAAAVLIILSLLARRIAPLYRHPSVIIVTGICMVSGVCLNFITTAYPPCRALCCWPALISSGVGIAFILMLWSEFFGCLNPLRVALYYSASIVISTLILWFFKGLSLNWLWVGTCLVPLVSLLCLWRSYVRLPRDAYPPSYQGAYSFPWKPVLVVGVYSLVYGLRSSIFSSFLAMNSGLGALAGAGIVYGAICIYRETFDFSLMWKVAVPLMVVSLVPLEGAIPAWAYVADFCALGSYTVLLVFIMVVLSNLSYRYGVCALWIFAIERAVRLLAAQAGRIVGHTFGGGLSPLIYLAIVAVMAVLLAFIAVFFFSQKQLSSPWGVVLKRPLAQDKELYLEKNRLGLKCHEVAKSYDLTTREEDILLMISQQKRTNEIASDLFIGKNTVKTHVRHIYQKLDVHSRAEVFDLLGVK